SQFGHDVQTASSGERGIELFKNQEVDVVICDLGMPEMNGWDVGRAIKKYCEETGSPKTPFILLTGWGGQLTLDGNMIESGIDKVLEKPVNLADLLSEIESVLEMPR
ncbi:response regulator, partial [Thermodesulfobacteriota bacterium]